MLTIHKCTNSVQVKSDFTDKVFLQLFFNCSCFCRQPCCVRQRLSKPDVSPLLGAISWTATQSFSKASANSLFCSHYLGLPHNATLWQAPLQSLLQTLCGGGLWQAPLQSLLQTLFGGPVAGTTAVSFADVIWGTCGRHRHSVLSSLLVILDKPFVCTKKNWKLCKVPDSYLSAKYKTLQILISFVSAWHQSNVLLLSKFFSKSLCSNFSEMGIGVQNWFLSHYDTHWPQISFKNTDTCLHEVHHLVWHCPPLNFHPFGNISCSLFLPLY